VTVLAGNTLRAVASGSLSFLFWGCLLSDIEWIYSEDPVEYCDAVSFMRDRVKGILSGSSPECVWSLEHPSVYTSGLSANPNDLLDSDRFLVCRTSRGGAYTYHGPGQRVVYLMLDLRNSQVDVRGYVAGLEDWVIRTLASCGVSGERRQGYVGVWVQQNQGKTLSSELTSQKNKIAAIGIRMQRWVTSHGVAINVNPNLEHFKGIIPCGITDWGVTSLADLGVEVSMNELDLLLRREFDPLIAFTTSTGQKAQKT